MSDGWEYRPKGQRGIERVRRTARPIPKGELVDPVYEPLPPWASLVIAVIGWGVFAVGEVFLIVMWLLGKG